MTTVGQVFLNSIYYPFGYIFINKTPKFGIGFVVSVLVAYSGVAHWKGRLEVCTQAVFTVRLNFRFEKYFAEFLFRCCCLPTDPLSLIYGNIYRAGVYLKSGVSLCAISVWEKCWKWLHILFKLEKPTTAPPCWQFSIRTDSRFTARNWEQPLFNFKGYRISVLRSNSI